jgi:3-hydroxy-9,10-secoandrosta-1,3,5(10)-triene-9,17-dione monooxygenase reductase component
VRHFQQRSRVDDSDAFRTVLAHFASGVTVVTAMTAEGPVGMTVQSFFSASLAPPLVAVSPSRTSRTWPKVRAAGAFCVNVLRREQAELCRGFAGSGADRFAGVRWRSAPQTGAPVIEQVLAWVECSIEAIHEAGDHYLVLARVLDLDASVGEPLVVYRRALGSFQA